MQKYSLEFILHTQDASAEEIHNSLAEFAESLEIADCQGDGGRGKDFKVNINTEEPTAIFDICAQFGRIKNVRIDELKKEAG
jgi:dihydroxyacetone kinase-like predicted kinase